MRSRVTDMISANPKDGSYAAKQRLGFQSRTQTCSHAAARRVTLAVIVDDAAALIGVRYWAFGVCRFPKNFP